MLHRINTQLVTLAGYSLECCQRNAHVLLFFSELEVECAIQFRRIGDKLSFRQKLLNLISKLFRSGTWLLLKPSHEEPPLKWDFPSRCIFQQLEERLSYSGEECEGALTCPWKWRWNTSQWISTRGFPEVILWEARTL